MDDTKHEVPTLAQAIAARHTVTERDKRKATAADRLRMAKINGHRRGRL
jgi:hypothetical protein